MDINTGQTIKKLSAHTDRVLCAAILPENKMISGSTDTTIKYWNTVNGACLKTLRGHFDIVFCAQVVSIDQILSGSRDSTIKLWYLYFKI